MITPRFELSQTNNEVTITIHAPYANILETEIFVSEEHFRFFSPPYFLRLHLPGSVEETDASSGRYESDAGKFVITVSKVTKGEHFDNLDLLTSLLTPRKEKPVIGKAGIEVISSTEHTDGASAFKDTNGDCSDSEWFIKQIPEEELEPLTFAQVTYGFANQCSRVFCNFKYEFNEIIQLRQPETTPVSERPSLQANAEFAHFSDEHYMADFMEDKTIKSLLLFQTTNHQEVHWTLEEQDLLKELPNREYLLSQSEREAVYYSLADILFAFCYNHRTNEGENNSESAWLINILSATLSWLQTFPSVSATLKSCFRRSLTYPLFRNYDLAVAVANDVVKILKAGKKAALKCMLEVHSLFNLSEPRYLLNQLYIKDYCVWIQQCSEQRLFTLGDNITKALPSKAELDLDLVELEVAAKLVQEEENFRQALDKVSTMQLATSSPTKSSSEPDPEPDPESDSESESDSSEDSESESDSTIDSDTTLGSDGAAEAMSPVTCQPPEPNNTDYNKFF